MKKQISILLILALPFSAISQTWNLLGPDTANISRIDFSVALQYHVLSADDGFYLYHYGNNTCEYFTNGGLPVTGTAYYNNEKILITMGNGSWSDGIYTFDLSTHEFWPVEYIVWPKFLHYDIYAPDDFWVGSEWGGLFRSGDGTIWASVETFTTFPCLAMASLDQNMVVQVISDLTNSYWSDDGGENWYPSELAPGFSIMAFHYSGGLLGVFPGYSNSSGLWKSIDQGNNWQIEIYQDNLSSVCYDVFSDIMVGYDGGGLGMYSPGSGITMLQNNPPNQNINNIQVNPTMSAPAIFVSTDEGAYFSYDYYVGMEEEDGFMSPVSISPNPAQTFIEVISKHLVNIVQILDVNGNICLLKKMSGKAVRLDISNLDSGLYFLQLRSEGRLITEKLVVR